MRSIHPTAIVDDAAELGDVVVGPYAVIGAGVRLHDGVTVGAHAVLEGATSVGEGTVVGPHAVVGGPPQDRKHDVSAPTRLEIGRDNVLREFTSVHRGSSSGRGVTTIGDRNYFMANSHVAHDCIIGSDTTFANSAAVGGHVIVGDGAVLGGLSAVHQFSRVGRLAMLGGGAMCSQDVPPFTIAQGDRARLVGVNILGLRRAGTSDETISVLKDAWRMLFMGELPRRTAAERVQEAHGGIVEVRELITFLETTTRGVCRAGIGPS
jgi:UDP-N-acetylglucosamine acyltransferase